KPQSKMTWDNAVWISPQTAQRNDLAVGDLIEIEFQGRKVSGPVWIIAGQADDSLAVHFGYGRTRAGRVADGIGFDAYALRTRNSLWHGAGAKISRQSRGYAFAITQQSQTMAGHDPFRIGTYTENREERVENASLFPQWE